MLPLRSTLKQVRGSLGITGWKICPWTFYIFRWMFRSHRKKRAPVGAVLLF